MTTMIMLTMMMMMMMMMSYHDLTKADGDLLKCEAKADGVDHASRDQEGTQCIVDVRTHAIVVFE
jgi:hypothetical protein